MTWTTLTLQVTTPLFNGGADAGDGPVNLDDGEGVRVASIRGAMRFWFRALAGSVAGPDLELLGALEREVFGSASTASPVQLRIPRQPRLSDVARPYFTDGEGGPSVIYLLGQGLTKYRREDKKFDVTRPYVDKGEKFTVMLRFSREDVGALALASLRLVAMYGGLGARTRRGFGGVTIIEAPDQLPAPWSARSLAGAGAKDHEGASCLFPGAGSELAGCREILTSLRAKLLKERHPKAPGRPASAFDDSWAGLPPYPALSEKHTICGLTKDTFTSWDHALCTMGNELRHFRASKPYPAAPYKPKVKTPEWEEVLGREATSDHFTVGALGLPVVFKEDRVVNVDQGEEKLRRASPLWLRVVGNDKQCRVLSFAFLGQFLPGPDSPEIHHWEHGRKQKQLQVYDDDVRSLATQWIDARKRGLYFDGDIRRK